LNVLTGLYAFRLWAVVFRGEPQTARGYAAKEARRVMLLPVVILGALSLVVAWPLQFPIPNTLHVFSDFLAPVFAAPALTPVKEPAVYLAALALLVGTAASLLGIGAALRLWYEQRWEPAEVAARLPRALVLLSYNKFYFDEIYDALLVRPVKTTARALRRVVEPEVMDGWVSGTASLLRGFSVDVRSFQTGLIRDYAAVFVGALVFVVLFVVLTTR
jgi:NADH-quinone oxidoreductase subunit L